MDGDQHKTPTENISDCFSGAFQRQSTNDQWPFRNTGSERSLRQRSNSIIKTSIVKIGSNKKYSEIELKGSHLHKGIRKIRHHCKKEHKVIVTGREIKALMSTGKNTQY